MAHRYIELFLNSTAVGGYGGYGAVAGAAGQGAMGRGFNGGQWGDAQQTGYSDAAYGGETAVGRLVGGARGGPWYVGRLSSLTVTAVC